jgi:hypothetical protein
MKVASIGQGGRHLSMTRRPRGPLQPALGKPSPNALGLVWCAIEKTMESPQLARPDLVGGQRGEVLNRARLISGLRGAKIRRDEGG